mmetsp:Transcript_2922/g.6355  ORF Transcript_2922/g.6355 Transcript_2922/m.6355 type:complete len:322 (+) Transcript_2922:338-1303(+)
MMMELRQDVITHFQYLSSWDNSSTPYLRYSQPLPFNSNSSNVLLWNAVIDPSQNTTQPYKYLIDRQVALASFHNVTQGAFMCANGGSCIAPDVCSCAQGWIGFDCRVPICEQGFYEVEQETFVQGVQSNGGMDLFERFLDPNRQYDLDSSRGFTSNPDFPTTIERFLDATTIVREERIFSGSRYYSNDGGFQGGYECSIRGVTEWEDYRSGFIFDHPNYWSRYMDEHIEGDGRINSTWKGMGFDPIHQKTHKLVKYSDEFAPGNLDGKIAFMYTDEGYRENGVWMATGAKWKKGLCIVEFDRRCEGSFKHIISKDDLNKIR